MKHSLRVLFLLACCVAQFGVTTARGQSPGAGFPTPAPPPGAEASPAALEAWQAILEERYIAAREMADAILRDTPDSAVGHIVAGVAQKYGEGNFPRSRYHLERARALIEEEWGQEPPPEGPWLWHLRTLRILSAVYGDLERYREQLVAIARYNEVYDPDLLAERAWPLMKLRRFSDARQAATDGIESGDMRQTTIGLNAHCAIEFEAGLDGVSYEACRRALEHARGRGDVTTVDLTNFAEASRSLFRLEEAESTLLEATRAQVSWYGNPWVDLADLYLRQGRFPEAADALKRSGPYSRRRPPHVQNSDRSERRRAVSALFLTIGGAEAALRSAEQATRLRDRRGHNSRDSEQDWAVSSLLERRARLLVAERTVERAVAKPWYRRIYASFEAAIQRFLSWMSGRASAKLFGDDDRAVGIFQVGTANSSTLAPWMIGDVIEVLGAGVAGAAIERARREDQRPGADAYYDAFSAESAWRQGDLELAAQWGRDAMLELPESEALLRARLLAIIADCHWRLGEHDSAIDEYGRAFQFDPGVLRRLGLRLPVRFEARGGDAAETLMESVERSPRFDENVASPFVVRAESRAEGLQVCLLAPDQSVLGCGEGAIVTQDGVSEVIRDVSSMFHEVAFSPRVDMSQADAASLDGSNQAGPNPLGDLLDLTDGP